MVALLENLGMRPSLVLAHPNPIYAASVSRSFRRLGWTVSQAQTGPAARQLARTLLADLVVLAIDLPGESGWLTCAKLIGERPGTHAVLIGDNLAPTDPEFARFVGAAGLYLLSAGARPLLQHAQQIDPTPVG